MRCLRGIRSHILIMRNGKRHSGRSTRKMKGNEMKNLFAQFRMEAEKRALYRVTRDEIARMPRAIAIDLGMFPEDADIIARKAVWG